MSKLEKTIRIRDYMEGWTHAAEGYPSDSSQSPEWKAGYLRGTAAREAEYDEAEKYVSSACAGTGRAGMSVIAE